MRTLTLTALRKRDAVLAEKVEKGVLTLRAATLLLRDREYAAARRAREAEEKAAAQARRERCHGMASTWARYVQAHGPMWSDAVIHHDVPLSHAVEVVQRESGCDPDSCTHAPLRPDVVAFVVEALVGRGEPRDKVEAVAAWDPDWVRSVADVAAIEAALDADCHLTVT